MEVANKGYADIKVNVNGRYNKGNIKLEQIHLGKWLELSSI